MRTGREESVSARAQGVASAKGAEAAATISVRRFMGYSCQVCDAQADYRRRQVNAANRTKP
jgi:hypothetical protein